MKWVNLLAIFLGLVCTSCIDQTHHIFFPKDLHRQIETQHSYPIFWWNFLVTDTKNPVQVCEGLKKLNGNLVRSVECQQDISQYGQVIEDWQKDQFLRKPPPSLETLNKAMDEALTTAGLPGTSGDIIKLLRRDPLGSWKDLKEISEKRVNLPFERKSGFFIDSKTGQTVIPLQMNFSPTKTAQTQKVASLWDENSFLIGPHGSSLINESQIKKDAGNLSVLAIGVLLVFAATLSLLGKWRLVLLLPVVLAGVAGAAVLTIVFFGSVHIVTLSFGVGLVGLSLDYGLHGALNLRSKTLWRSNFFGLLTTLVGLIILGFSEIPLIRQLMVFSGMGITLSFGLFYFFLQKYPDFFEVPPFDYAPKPSLKKLGAVALLVGVSFVTFSSLKINLDMQAFDYKSPKEKEVTNWLFSALSLRSPLFHISQGDMILNQGFETKFAADLMDIGLENIASYLPQEFIQQGNIDLWKSFCEKLQLDQTKTVFFKPFIDSLPCHSKVEVNSGKSIPSYLEPLHYNGAWLNLWIPKNDDEEQRVRSFFHGSDILSLREIAGKFPAILSKEVRWMGVVALLLATFLLVVHNKSLFFSLAALLPFMTGVGLVGLSSVVWNLDLSFISLVALIMLFGLSFDYGIFATDMMRGKSINEKKGVVSAIAIAAATTTGGLFPLLFCKHPVLLHLGHTLFFGALGTFIGALFGVPSLIWAKEKYLGHR